MVRSTSPHEIRYQDGSHMTKVWNPPKLDLLHTLANILDRVKPSQFSMTGDFWNTPEAVDLDDLMEKSSFDAIGWLAMTAPDESGWIIEDFIPKWNELYGLEAVLSYFLITAEQYNVLFGFSVRGPKEEAEHIRAWCKEHE